MLRLPRFEVLEPTTVAEATELLARHGDKARIMAGGTDLVPNMKHELETPEVVIGLWRIGGLDEIREEGDKIRIGALLTLDRLAEHPLIVEQLPSLADAVGQVAGPQLRRMGTIGGNVCLDTRCVYINQTYFWRQALGFCLKKDGTVCHVVAGGRRCVAAASNDSAPVLMTLGAKLEFASPRGTREVPIDEFYVPNGAFNQDRKRDELLTHIVVPKPKQGTIMAYVKLRTRGAIDFPELGVAVLAERDEEELVERADVCITALAARPLHVPRVTELVSGRPLDDAAIDAVAKAAYERSHPLTNISTDPDYRREMVPVFVRRAFRAALARSGSNVWPLPK
jgi:4-hydroxybenzoyl-CoA reductase subunit beta